MPQPPWKEEMSGVEKCPQVIGIDKVIDGMM